MGLFSFGPWAAAQFEDVQLGDGRLSKDFCDWP